MPLPEPILDDLRFQKDLVDEARRRIIRYCPEWTDYNLSDPGITLIELFAWMTEMTVYRLNRVPEKNFFKFMELIGLHLHSASSARTELTFWLSAPFPLGPEDNTTATVPHGTEIATLSADDEPEVIFTTDRKLSVTLPRLDQLRRTENFHKNYIPRLGIETFFPFNQTHPQEGDTFYLGFDDSRDISGHILRLTFECEQTQAVGIRREDPPLVWEASLGGGEWREVPPSNRPGERNSTGGLNNPQGSLTLYLPLTMKPDEVNGRLAYWVRCRFEVRRNEQGRYTESPRILNVTAHTLGATTEATHAVLQYGEEVGLSNGDPGQSFQLQHAPILSLQPGETIEIEEKRDNDVVFVPWQVVTDFSKSSRYDRHFTLDTATGQVMFGPAVRQRDGSVFQYGRVPEAGRQIRFNQYRYGGGIVGNVPAGKLQSLRSALPYIDRVTNLIRASGGRDQESLEEAKLRVPQELRAQQRAVTAEDYENLAKGASRAIARVKALAPGMGGRAPNPGAIELLIVPAVAASLQTGDLTRLGLDETSQNAVLNHIDQYRLLTTKVIVREPAYVGVHVLAEIVINEYSQPEQVRQRVLKKLQQFISPLPLTEDNDDLSQTIGSAWDGWPFGRDLYVAELYSLVQHVPGVKHVLDVQLETRPVIPNREFPPQLTSEDEALAESKEDEGEGESSEALPHAEKTAPVKERKLTVPDDTLLCSLTHQINIVEV